MSAGNITKKYWMVLWLYKNSQYFCVCVHMFVCVFVCVFVYVCGRGK